MQDTGPGNGKNAGWCETWAFGSVADAWTVPGALARLADTWTGTWGSGSVYLEKVPVFFDFAGTFFDAKPIEALFTAQSGLTRELLTPKFHIDPRTSLLILPETVYSPAFSTGSGHNKLTSQNIL